MYREAWSRSSAGCVAAAGLPKQSWIAGLEASRHADGTVYMTVDNHRSDDNRNYVFRSTDFGASWSAITGDLPADRIARTIEVANVHVVLGQFTDPALPAKNVDLALFHDVMHHVQARAEYLKTLAGTWPPADASP